MNLFLLVWTSESYECEWTHIVSEKPHLDWEDEQRIMKEFMLFNHELTAEEAEDDCIDLWSNKVADVDGYAVELTKKTEVDPEVFNNFLGIDLEESLAKLTIRKDK